jgi:hypothetical protein
VLPASGEDMLRTWQQMSASAQAAEAVPQAMRVVSTH